MGPVLPVNALDVDQPEVRLVDERRCLQAVPGAFARHAASGNAPQFLVHQRDQLIEGGLIAFSPCEKKSSDLARMTANGQSYYWGGDDVQLTTMLSIEDCALPTGTLSRNRPSGAAA